MYVCVCLPACKTIEMYFSFDSFLWLYYRAAVQFRLVWISLSYGGYSNKKNFKIDFH